MEFMQTTTPHEAFSLMLLERVGRLEDEVLQIQRTLPYQVPYEWLRFTFYTPLVFGEYTETFYRNFRELCVNTVFSTRQHTRPEFAMWHWHIDTETQRYILKLYIRLGVWTPMAHFQQMTQMILMSHWCPTNSYVDIHPLQGGASDVKMILKHKLGYHAEFPQTDEEEGVELWRRGGDSFHERLDETWHTDAFLKSTNYTHSPDQLPLLRDWMLFLIKNKGWLQLFRLEE